MPRSARDFVNQHLDDTPADSDACPDTDRTVSIFVQTVKRAFYLDPHFAGQRSHNRPL
jgi:hypothetical protein